ncbi:polysaccharide pyruvyl transferase family protein [Microbacterium sp. G2-8]|uniref:polysaccharide pyruvyl transferase family protein n=1 Tax=Microbacterium sp. G2-8 TaxID=2842454 RepID=UPI001C8A2C2F|nr:polysaccharide pyruvyl transferase family protein [Microbacterium sp. G2-8]
MSFDDDEILGVRVPRWRPDEPGAPTNFGDEIGPMLVRALRGESVARGAGRLLSVGSILHFARAGDVVWGAGINGKVRQRIQYPLDVRSVRGPLTRSVLLGFGIPVPETYGDPALLFPRLFPDIVPSEQGGVVTVPNLNELGRVAGDGVVSPLADPRQIAARIAGADFVVASSLHALVLADAYGVPSRPLVPEAEHPFKYLDYYAGTGRPGIAFARSVEEAIALGPVAAPDVDLDRLAGAFPADLWAAEKIAAPANDSRDYADLRRASERQRAALVLGIGREASDAAAQAILRAHHTVASQDRALTALLEATSEDASTEDDALVARAIAFLRECPARGDIDRRVARALRRSTHARQLGGGADAIACRVAATGKLSLARRLVSGDADLAEGRAHLAQTEESVPPAPPEAAAGIARRALRGVGRRIRRT